MIPGVFFFFRKTSFGIESVESGIEQNDVYPTSSGKQNPIQAFGIIFKEFLWQENHEVHKRSLKLKYQFNMSFLIYLFTFNFWCNTLYWKLNLRPHVFFEFLKTGLKPKCPRSGSFVCKPRIVNSILVTPKNLERFHQHTFNINPLNQVAIQCQLFGDRSNKWKKKFIIYCLSNELHQKWDTHILN